MSECGRWWCDDCLTDHKKAESLAAGVMTAEDTLEVRGGDWDSPASFVDAKYGIEVDPTEFTDEHALETAVLEARQSGRVADLEASGGERHGTPAQSQSPDERAAGALGAEDTLKLEASDATAARFVREKYGLRASEYPNEESLRAALADAEGKVEGGHAAAFSAGGTKARAPAPSEGADIETANDLNIQFTTGGTAMAATAGATSLTAENGLTGTIWAAGTATPRLGDERKKVYIPPETIGPTFEALRERVAAGEATIGFDHPKKRSVAAQTPLGEIGIVRGVSRSADGEKIVLTDSEFTNSKAVEAAETGGFDDLDYSVIGMLAFESDEDGDPVRRDDGALKLAAVRIGRVDVVLNGAITDASVGAMPELAAGADDLAAAALAAEDTLTVEASDVGPAEFVRSEYGVDPARFDTEESLVNAISNGEVESTGGAGQMLYRSR